MITSYQIDDGATGRSLQSTNRTHADEETLTSVVLEQQRRPDQEIEVRFLADGDGGDGTRMRALSSEVPQTPPQ